MFDTIHSDFPFVAPLPADTLLPLRTFAQGHSEALINAGAILGGRRGACVARAMIEGLIEQVRPTRRLMRQVSELVELLTLENVHDMSRGEAACFAAIEPWDPRVEEICLLTEGLLQAVGQCRSLLPDTAALCDVARA